MRRLIAFAIATVSSVIAGTAAPTAEPSAREVVEARIAAVARHDLDAVVALYAADAIETSPAFCADRTGPEGARRTYGDLFKAVPNITSDVTTWVVDGNRVAIQFVAHSRKADGTFALAVPIANFLVVEHGKIVRDDTYFDAKGQLCS